MYNTENPYKSAGEYLKAPLFEKYQLRRAAVKTSTALFPFMLFAAIFAFIILILGKVFPSLLDGLYWVSYMSVQLFGIGMSICMAYYAGGFFSALVSGVLAVYFGLFCTQVAGVETIGGSSVIGFMGYYVIALLSTVCVTFLHKVCVVVIEWAFGLLLKLAHSKIKDEAKREELICTFRPQLKNMTLLGDSLVVIGLSAFAVFFVMNYAYALPMTLLAHKLAGIVASSANIILKGAVIGFALGFDGGGPLSLAVFDEIFKGVLAGSMESARLLTVFSAAMITPSWICMIYLFVGKKFKSWPMVVYDENLLNTGFINEVFQNVRLMAMSPMVYCVREPQTTPFALIGGTTLTGILAAAFGICNESFLTDYARKYGLLRTSTIVVTDKYDAFAGLLPPLYAGGGAKVILLSFAAALVGSLLGVGIVVLLKKARYSKQEKRGEDLFLAYGYEFTQQEWNETYKKKSKLEQKLGLAGDIEENEPELEPAE